VAATEEPELVPRSFYDRDALDVARDVVGKHLVHGPVVLRITEVEAYRWPDDTAGHCRFGPTARTAPLFGPPGHAYVYLCYGIHWMLNLVCGPPGDGSAVLIRSCEPVGGLEVIEARRGGKSGPVLLTGPGKVAQALAVDKRHNHEAFFEAGGLELREGGPPIGLLAGPRVGIDFAAPKDRDAPWRLAMAGSLWVSEPRGLEPVQNPPWPEPKTRRRD
jgi:DNA-3-methyladenine glycosylase